MDQLSEKVKAALLRGQVIPAHPLALTDSRKLDEKRQRALTRYYLDAGAGGIAVAVHTTQFEIRRPEIGLLRPVLKLASDEIDDYVARTSKPVIKVAGIAGETDQAAAEAAMARHLGYDIGLLSLSAFAHADNGTLLKHCRVISEIIPLFGFYLQPAVGGRFLDVDFWRGFVDIENVSAIKIAPFNRYRTLDVVRAVAESGRADDIALYTGNDDNIVADLLTKYRFPTHAGDVEKSIVGGLLGHWSIWTKSVCDMFRNIVEIRKENSPVPQDVLTLGSQVTDCNAAIFDVAHNFSGCITGIQEILRRQGLLENHLTLDPRKFLHPAHRAEIDRVVAAYPFLTDDAFVREHLCEWLG